MTCQTTKHFLEERGLYSDINEQRYRDWWTLTEIKNGFQFEIYKKEFYSDTDKYYELMDRINKYQ